MTLIPERERAPSLASRKGIDKLLTRRTRLTDFNPRERVPSLASLKGIDKLLTRRTRLTDFNPREREPRVLQV